MVGSSTASAGSASGAFGSQTVSETWTPSIPLRQTMSPAPRGGQLDAFEPPGSDSTDSTRPLRTRPAVSTTATEVRVGSSPRRTRPMPMTPT